VLYRLLTGRLPFNADTAISMVQMQISEPPTPMVNFRPDLPAWCARVVERALAKSPSDRFQSAEEFRSALLAAVTPQALGEMPTLATPTPPGISLDPDATLPHRTPIARPAATATGSTSPPIRGVMTPPPPTPTPSTIPPAERTGTTVVLGRTHLAALATLIVVVGVGVAILAFAALRQRASQTPPAATTTASETPAAPAAGETPATTPAPPGATPTATPAAATPVPAPPAAAPPVKPTPATPTAPSTGGVATVGAVPGAKPAGRGTSTATTPPVDPALAGRGTIDPKATAAAEPPPGGAPPLATFNQVRVLVNEGEKSREREGILQLGGGQIAVVPSSGAAPIVSVPTSALSAVFYSRSKQPRWKDASGQDVESKIDLGRMGFLRGERNWIVLITGGEPVILRIEDSALRTVLPAIEERTGQKIRR
jgi:hypothetical protein